MEKHAEILAPAGGEAQLRAAVLCGADAVYLGLRGFNARAGAENFDESTLPQGFAPGTRVRHAVFGPGTVLELDPAQRAQLVQFDSMPTPRLLSLRTKLERI